MPGMFFVHGEGSRPWTPEGHDGAGYPATPSDVDVVIVGGGFSGLTAAYNLQQAGLTTVTLEARNLIGGKSRSLKREKGLGYLEMGATWINEVTQPNVFQLTQDFGLEVVEQYIEGQTIFQDTNGTVSWNDQGGDPEPSELFLILIIEAAALLIDNTVFDKWPLKMDVTFAEWVDQLGMWKDPHLQNICRGLTQAIVGREPEDIGAHYFLDYISSGQGLVKSLMAEDRGGAQYQWLKNGTTSIAMSLAGAMTPGSVLIDTPVRSITQHENVTVVTSEDGQSFNAKKVVIAMTQNVWSNVEFTPPLPCSKRALAANTKPGIYAKVLVSYTEPWWRTAGWVGKLTSFKGPIGFSWEISEDSLSLYALALFIAGDHAVRWHALSAPERREAVLEHLAELVGEDLAVKARVPLEYEYVEWTKEEYILGGPTSSMGPGMLRKYGAALREPFGSLHFAGTETAYDWKGYLEGAVTAGQRAAREIVAELGPEGEVRVGDVLVAE
ncbi:amine oxidase [Plectosphaerella plurivora]|uniref:Amine oxidase n=1 Tax=Plectosphaerella plurivora TaxID=936078 RepID=A0A9P9ACT2_9PEZI|nr:amine oxidase [Plectosphaerella plurivora]